MSVRSKFFDRIDALEPELVELTHVETKSFDVPRRLLNGESCKTLVKGYNLCSKPWGTCLSMCLT